MRHFSRLRSPLFQLLLALLSTLLIVGCDLTGSSSEDSPPSEEDGGAVSFSLVRTANSDVPSDADSAFVRVWKPSGSFNLRESVNVPDPGQRTEVSLEVPADTGYRAGVLATGPGGFGPNSKTLLAHGSSGQFTLGAGDTARADLNVRPATIQLETPSSVKPNQKDTILAVFNINPPGVNPSIGAAQGSTPSFDYFDASSLNKVSTEESDTTVTQSFEITGPNVNSEDTTYVKVTVVPGVESDWIPPGREFQSDFFPSEEGTSFEIPVVPGSGNDDGTVIITFSRDGDGWEKTRRVVE